MKRVLSLSQWLITLLLCLFLIVPVVLSMAVGLTRNYIRGFKSGWTLDWVAQVWDMYHASIWMSLLVALCTLVIVLAAGVPAGYVLARRQSRASRLIEEFLTLPVALPGLATPDPCGFYMLPCGSFVFPAGSDAAFQMEIDPQTLGLRNLTARSGGRAQGFLKPTSYFSKHYGKTIELAEQPMWAWTSPTARPSCRRGTGSTPPRRRSTRRTWWVTTGCCGCGGRGSLCRRR